MAGRAAAVRSPQRKTARPGRGKHLLSMITQCDVDNVAERVMLAYLSRSDVIDTLRAGDQHDNRELSAVRDQSGISWLSRGPDANNSPMPSRPELSVSLAAHSEPVMLAEIATLEAREKELATPSVLRGLIEPGADVARRWDAASMSTRREIARLLLRPDLIGELRVTPSLSRGHRVPAEDRI